MVELYKVIDGDKNIVLQFFTEDEREKILQYYKNLGKYKDVSEDHYNDVICFAEL